MRLILFGPQTQLGRAVLSSSWAREQPLTLVVRHQAEADWGAATYPNATLLPAWGMPVEMPEENTAVVILCCAFGIIHPAPPDLENDMAVAQRDLHVLRHLLLRYAQVPVHVLFVSSVLALSPRPDRAYYAGWKNVLAASVAHLVQQHSRAVLSTLYPGRLVERYDFAQPTSLLYTRYQRLARTLIDVVQSETPRTTLVGLDARLWLTFRMLATLRTTLTGWV